MLKLFIPDLISFMLALNALAVFVVGAVVYISREKKLQNAIWFVYNILFSIWSFCMYKAQLSTEASTGLYWIRASFVTLIFIAPVFLHFLSIYSDKEVFKKRIIGRVYTIFFLIFAAVFFMPKEFVKGVTAGAYFKYVVEPTIPFHILTFIFWGFILCGFYYLLHSRKLYLTFKRNQRSWLFAGMFLGLLAPLNFFLAVYKITFFPAGIFFVITYLGITSYVILKYHVPEIDVLVNKMVTFAYAALFVIFLHIAGVYLLHRLMGIEYFESSIVSGCMVLLLLLFALHFFGGELKLKKISEKVVYERRFNYYRFLENFSFMLGKEKDLTILLSFIVDSLRSIVGVDCVSLYLFDEDSAKFKLKVQRGIKKEKLRKLEEPSLSSPFIDFLKDGNIFVADEQNDFGDGYNLKEIMKTFEKINVKLSIPLHYSMPLYYSRDMVGFLNIGKKVDRSKYAKEDIDILNAFGRQLGICLDNAKLYTRSIEDDLTRLYRYNYFHMRVEEEIARSARYKRPFSLLMIDVDDFKNINDCFGHQVGNEALRRVARIMKSSLRKVDIAARYGGEEFGVLLPETEKEKAYIAAERIRKSVEDEFAKPDSIKEIIKKCPSNKAPFKITISIGISAYRTDIEKEMLIKEADQALYKAKNEGKNRVC